MKKLINFCFMIFASASFLFAADFSAQVVSVSGKAEFLSGGEWKPLAAGASLKNGDSVQTGFKSSLVLKIKDSTVNVAPLTRMTVEQLAENPEKDSVKLFVNAGGVSSSVKKTSGKKVGFTVRTPVATAFAMHLLLCKRNGEKTSWHFPIGARGLKCSSKTLRPPTQKQYR